MTEKEKKLAAENKWLQAHIKDLEKEIRRLKKIPAAIKISDVVFKAPIEIPVDAETALVFIDKMKESRSRKIRFTLVVDTTGRKE